MSVEQVTHGEFVAAQHGDLPSASTSKTAEVVAVIDRYIQRSPSLAPHLEPVGHLMAETERYVTTIRQRFGDSLEYQERRAERRAKTDAALAKLFPLDAAAELRQRQDHLLSLEPLPAGAGTTGYVVRKPDAELQRSGSPRQVGIWNWFLGLSPAERSHQYFAAIDSDDTETVNAIEMLPRSMDPLTDDIKEKARERKLRRLPSDLQRVLQEDQERLAALSGLSTVVSRALSQL